MIFIALFVKLVTKTIINVGHIFSPFIILAPVKFDDEKAVESFNSYRKSK